MTLWWPVNVLAHNRTEESKIDQFRYIKIQSKTIGLSMRLWRIDTEFVGFIPQSLVPRPSCLCCILIYRNWSYVYPVQDNEGKNTIPCPAAHPCIAQGSTSLPPNTLGRHLTLTVPLSTNGEQFQEWLIIVHFQGSQERQACFLICFQEHQSW